MNMKKLFIAALSCLALVAGATTRTWTGSWDTLPSATSDDIVVASGGNLTWSNSFPQTVNSWTQSVSYAGTVTFTTVFGNSGFTNFTVTGNVDLDGGVWSHVANTSAEANRLQVTVLGNLTMGTNTSISGAALGFTALNGIVTVTDGSCGGNYGGLGALWNAFAKTGTVYGSISTPVNLGSGGGTYSGGGCIQLRVGGLFSIGSNSTVTVDAQSGGAGGGGAGGSIFVTAGNLTGYGSFSAKGGNAGNRGGGGGGRISIVLTNSAAFDGFVGSILASGGSTSSLSGGPDGGPGSAGTIYQKTIIDNGVLIINNGGLYNRFETYIETIITNIDLNTFSKLVLTNSGLLALGPSNPFDMGNILPIVGGGELHIRSGTPIVFPVNCVVTGQYILSIDNLTNTIQNLTISSGCGMTHRPNYDTESYKLNLIVATNLTIQTNASINVDGRGYFAVKGTGVGLQNTGGSYGGSGGNHDDFTVFGNTYGSVIAPTNIGSGGASLTAKNNGGGSVVVQVGGTCTIASGAIITSGGSGFADIVPRHPTGTFPDSRWFRARAIWEGPPGRSLPRRSAG